MKKIFAALTLGCSYAILTVSVFYICAAISGGTNLVLSPLRFFLLTAFGLLVSFINLAIGHMRVGAVIRESLRYFAILLSFILAVSLSGTVDTRAATVISVAAIFTLFYLLIMLVAVLVKRGSRRSEAEGQKKRIEPEKKEKKAYKPLYSDSTDK